MWFICVEPSCNLLIYAYKGDRIVFAIKLFSDMQLNIFEMVHTKISWRTKLSNP